MSGLEDIFISIVGTNPIWQGLAGGIVIATFNMIGALAVLVFRNPSERLMDGALGFAAGVMLAASFTSLILPGIEAGGILPVMIGVVIGALVLDRSDAWVPHVHVLVTGRLRQHRPHSPETAASNGNGMRNGRFHSVVLFIVAITLHNMPEGLAVGVGFGAESASLGNALSLMLAIGIQNVPEGLAVAVAMRNAGMGTLTYAAITGIRSGLVEIPLALLGAAVVVVAEPLLPYAMGFAAGAMLYVISNEIIPETHSRGYERIATLGLIVGVIIMLTLDVALA